MNDRPAWFTDTYEGPPAWIEKADGRMPQIVYWDNDDTIKRLTYKDRHGNIHRDNGPAIIEFYQTGIQSLTRWIQDNVPHRTDEGPIITQWHPNGIKALEQWPEGIERQWDTGGNSISC